MVSDAVIREHLQRVVPLQENFNQNLERLNEVKREARSDGMSMEALNAFLPILVRNPHDKGARVLNEMLRYGEALGVEIAVPDRAGVGQLPVAAAGEAPEPAPPAEDPPRRPAVRDGGATTSRLRLATQLVFAVSLSVGLLWLLN